MTNTQRNLLYRVILIATAIILLVLIISRKQENDGISIKRFVLIQYNDSPLSELSHEGIIEGLTNSGFVKDHDYKMKVNNAQGDISTLNLMIDAALNDRPDLIFVTSTPTLQIAAKKIKHIPIVFTVVADPINAGVGSSFENHQPNITGISTMGDYEGMVNWLKIIMPGIKSVGTLFTPGEFNSVKNLEEFKRFSEAAGIELITVPVNSSSEVTDAAMALASKKPDIICQIIDNLTSGAFSGIVKIARKEKIPLFGFVSEQAEEGAIFVISRNYKQAGIDAALLAKKILDGHEPETIPFEFVSLTDIIVNRDAATYFGIELPASILENDKTLFIGE